MSAGASRTRLPRISLADTDLLRSIDCYVTQQQAVKEYTAHSRSAQQRRASLSLDVEGGAIEIHLRALIARLQTYIEDSALQLHAEFVSRCCSGQRTHTHTQVQRNVNVPRKRLFDSNFNFWSHWTPEYAKSGASQVRKALRLACNVAVQMTAVCFIV